MNKEVLAPCPTYSIVRQAAVLQGPPTLRLGPRIKARVSADKAYSGRGNLALVDSAGAVPYIPFRSNAKPTSLPLWVRMYEFFHENGEEFYCPYHRGSNVETTFAMIKAKFGEVRSKNATAQVNEVLAKGAVSQPMLPRKRLL